MDEISSLPLNKTIVEVFADFLAYLLHQEKSIRLAWSGMSGASGASGS